MTKQRLGFLLAVTSILITGSAIAQTKPVTVKPPTIPCVDAVTGAVKIKNKCNTRLGEFVLNVAQLLSAIPDTAQGPQGAKGDKGDPGAPGEQGPKGDAGSQGPQGASGGFNPFACQARVITGQTTALNQDVLQIDARCNQGEFMLTHGIDGHYDVSVQGFQLVGVNNQYPIGVLYTTGKLEPLLNFTWSQSVAIVCCPLPQ